MEVEVAALEGIARDIAASLQRAAASLTTTLSQIDVVMAEIAQEKAETLSLKRALGIGQ